MIHNNKNQLLATPRKQDLQFKNYNMQFTYSSSKKNHRKLQHLSSNKNYSSDTHQVSQSIEVKSQVSQRTENLEKSKSLAISYKNKSRNKEEILEDDEISFVTQCFPQRKVKTNQHQLFKYLSKLQDNQARRLKTEHLDIKIDRAGKGQDSKNLFKPHLKLKLSPKWVKSRYCANRDRDNGMLPTCFKPFQRGSDNRFDSVGVKNPFGSD